MNQKKIIRSVAVKSSLENWKYCKIYLRLQPFRILASCLLFTFNLLSTSKRKFLPQNTQFSADRKNFQGHEYTVEKGGVGEYQQTLFECYSKHTCLLCGIEFGQNEFLVMLYIRSSSKNHGQVMWLWSSIETLSLVHLSRVFRWETVVSKARNLYYFDWKQQ